MRISAKMSSQKMWQAAHRLASSMAEPANRVTFSRRHVAQAPVHHPRRPHTRQQSRRTGRLPNPPRRWRLLDSVHRLQTRRLAPLLPAPGSVDVAVAPADATLDVSRVNAAPPPPLRVLTTEELVVAAKKRQIAELRRKLDEVMSA